jgi:hypothetical protein
MFNLSGWDDSQRLEIGSPRQFSPTGSTDMTVHTFPITNDARPPGSGLLHALEQWRDADGTAPAPAHDLEHRAIDANRALIEQAKGALMLRYGMDHFQAFALLVRWSRLTHTPVQSLAETLVHGLGEANTFTDVRHRPLIRWLEDQLSQTDP